MSIESYGEYQLLKKLATGGMAQIFLARQQGMEGFEKFLVVKRILPHLAENDDFIKMFLDEARIAARLNHPNIVQIFNLGAQDDSYFIAMEFIHGEDVRRVWKRADSKQKPIPVPLVARIIMDACSGLDYAHKKVDSQGKPLNIVHRDISPQNILVTFEGGVKVVDFGIAKAADQATVTKSGVLKGKYSYMSPEQAGGQKIDRRSDIFALGVVLYELITGTRLFKRPSDIQTLNAVSECDVLPPSEVKPGLPKDLDPIVMKALAKLPQDRYQDAIGFQAALEEWVLKNQLPSSSVQLAGFMQDIYAERLAQEAEEGRILIEGLETGSRTGDDKLGDRERATPSLKSIKPTTSMRALEKEAQESTRAESPGAISGAISRSKALDRALERPPKPDKPSERPSLPRNPRILDDELGGATITSTERTGSKRSAAIGLVLFGLVAAVGAFVAWQAIGSPVRSQVRVTTDPEGASVRFDGKLLAGCSTPCVLPAVPAGFYTLLLSRKGFEDLRTRIEVPEKGVVALPAFKLLEEKKAVIPSGDAVILPVAYNFKSVPPGAQLIIDGKPVGITPMFYELLPHSKAEVLLRLQGYHDLSMSQPTGDGPQEFSYTLEKTAAAVHVVQTPPPPPKKETGKVRFIVKPWARVQCGAYKLGDTPFEDAVLPAGPIDCTFSNPDFPEKKQVVTVKANDTIRVAVNF